jgi:hypothetical protein
MNQKRLIFYLVFAVFHLGAFIFTLVLPSVLFDMVKYVPWFKYATFFGLLLLVTDVVWSYVINRDAQREKDALTHELNTLKAKLYDLQEAGKDTSAPKPPKA